MQLLSNGGFGWGPWLLDLSVAEGLMISFTALHSLLQMRVADPEGRASGDGWEPRQKQPYAPKVSSFLGKGTLNNDHITCSVCL